MSKAPIDLDHFQDAHIILKANPKLAAEAAMRTAGLSPSAVAHIPVVRAPATYSAAENASTAEYVKTLLPKAMMGALAVAAFYPAQVFTLNAQNDSNAGRRVWSLTTLKDNLRAKGWLRTFTGGGAAVALSNVPGKLMFVLPYEKTREYFESSEHAWWAVPFWGGLTTGVAQALVAYPARAHQIRKQLLPANHVTWGSTLRAAVTPTALYRGLGSYTAYMVIANEAVFGIDGVVKYCRGQDVADENIPVKEVVIGMAAGTFCSQLFIVKPDTWSVKHLTESLGGVVKSPVKVKLPLQLAAANFMMLACLRTSWKFENVAMFGANQAFKNHYGSGLFAPDEFDTEAAEDRDICDDGQGSCKL